LTRNIYIKTALGNHLFVTDKSYHRKALITYSLGCVFLGIIGSLLAFNLLPGVYTVLIFVLIILVLWFVLSFKSIQKIITPFSAELRAKEQQIVIDNQTKIPFSKVKALVVDEYLHEIDNSLNYRLRIDLKMLDSLTLLESENPLDLKPVTVELSKHYPFKVIAEKLVTSDTL